jgi:hypothetical protein
MLVKRTVDEQVLNDALQGATLSAPLRALLAREFQDETSVQAALAAFRKEMPTGGQDDLILEELKEIRDDLKWAKTKKGRLILACNEVVPRLYRTIRSEWGLSEVMIGAHAEKLAVMVAGHVGRPDDKQRVIALVRGSFECPVIDALVVK